MKRPQGFERTERTESGETDVGPIESGPIETLTEPIPLLEDRPEPDSAGAAGRLREAARRRRRVERHEVRRFTGHLRRRRVRWIVAASTVLLLALFVVVGAYSPAMALTTIRVDGASDIPTTAIRKALSGQLGRPLTLIDYTSVKKDLAGFRLIRSYTTEVHPPHTLVVRIVERTPIGLVKTDDGYDLVDGAGVVLSSSAKPPAGYPVIVTGGGTDSDSARTSLRAAADVLLAMPSALRAQVETISATTRDNVSFQLRGGENVVWGGADHSALKAKVLADLIAVSAGRSVHEYDVSSPKSAVVR